MKGEFVRYNRKSGYKLMSNMAHFHPDYKLLDNMVFNGDANEATSMMDFSATCGEGTFAAHPAYVDAITQVGGFAMNANDNTDIDKEVFVNHGWESFQVYQPLVKNKSYEVYTKMHKDKTGDLVHGDTIVLDGDDVVAFFKGLSVSTLERARRGDTDQSFSFAPFHAERCVLCYSLLSIKVSANVVERPLLSRRPSHILRSRNPKQEKYRLSLRLLLRHLRLQPCRKRPHRLRPKAPTMKKSTQY